MLPQEELIIGAGIYDGLKRRTLKDKQDLEIEKTV